MFCTYCGQTTNDDQAQFCQRCGQPFAATTNRLAEPAPTFVPQPGAPVPAAGSMAPETDPKAIASLVCSLVFFFAPLTQIAAIILGHMSRSDIRKSGGRKTGDGLALTGLILGYVQIGFVLVLIVAAVAIPSLLRARQRGNEAAAISNVRTIVSAETAFQSQKQAYTCEPGDLDQPAKDLLSGGAHNGYTFALSGCSAEGFQLLASPVNASTGSRTLCADQTGNVRSLKGVFANDAERCLQSGQPHR
jgi:type II secretory pathway pseudopilin PulG